MRKPSFIIFNDIHIKSGNEEDVYMGVEYLVEYAKKINVNQVVLNGDVFDSRSFQRLSHLKCFERILDLFKFNNIICHTIVGNHDKSLYESKDNFIEPFKYHPSIRLYSNIKDITINNIDITVSPFFTDKILIKQLNENNGNDILIGHYSVDGSTYLGKEESKNINKKILSKWKKVYLGHFHNFHEVTKDIIHLPSLIQSNFGEDSNKGFSVIYDDLSYEVVKGKFKEFVKINVDINESSIKEIKQQLLDYQNFNGVVRFEITGDDSKLKSIDKTIFTEMGIDVKLKFDKKYNLEKNEKQIPILNEVYDKDDIRKEFKKFCNEKGYDYSFGNKLLEKFFKDK